VGVRQLEENVWNHVAVTYDVATLTWSLYLNGVLDVTKVEIASGSPQDLSIQHSSIGSALNSTGVAAGFFKGSIDDVRIWNYARSAAQIAANATQQITSETGLIGAYNLNEGAGTTATNTGSAASVNGTLTPTATPPTYVTGVVRTFPTALVASPTFISEPGDIMFVGFNADGTDGIAFIPMKKIAANTKIFFTDNEVTYAGPAFNTGESHWEWTSPNAVVEAGTVIRIATLSAIATTPTTTLGTVAWSTTATPNNNGGLSATGESVVAYFGTSYLQPTTFLGGFSIDNFAGFTLSGTGLVVGTNAMAGLTAAPDVAVYSGSTVCNGTLAQCRAALLTLANWSIQDAGTSDDTDGVFPDFPASVPGNFTGTALPVEWLTFTATHKDKTVALAWTTATERNNVAFAVQRSQDGQNFSTIGTVKGAGNSNAWRNYHFVDLNPTSGVVYYRLQQQDEDGKTTVSKIVVVNMDGQIGIHRLYPTVAAETLILEATTEGAATIIITDLAGKTVLTQYINADGYSQQMLYIAQLPYGAYFLTLQAADSKTTMKFIKQ
jgi:hypothetical protein